MEKEINKIAEQVFNGLSFTEVIKYLFATWERVRDRHLAGSEIKDGCVLVAIQPLCEEAHAWMGSIDAWNNKQPADACQCVYSKPLTPGGSYVIERFDPDDGRMKPVNCRTRAIAKVAYLSRLVEQNIDSVLYDTESSKFCEANGYSHEEGAVSTTVCLRSSRLMRLYVCFATADPEMDRNCATQLTYELRERLKRKNTDLVFISRAVDGSLP